MSDMGGRDRVRTVVGLVVAGLVVAFIAYSRFTSPGPADDHFAAEIAAARAAPVEEGLGKLDALLGRPELATVRAAIAESAGAALVELAAKNVPAAFSRAHLDHGLRVIRRYRTLPHRAQQGAARDQMLAAIDRWSAALAAPADRRAQLALLEQAADVTDARRSAAISQRIVEARRLAAEHAAADAPLDALSIAVGSPRDAACLAIARTVLESIADKPSLLDDASSDVDSWLASVPAADPLRVRIEAQRELARAARAETADPAIAAAQLRAMLARRPWDQRAALALARRHAQAGRSRDAEALLRSLGPPALLVRDARFALAQLAIEAGKLDEGDALLEGLIASRIDRFRSAAAAVETAAVRVHRDSVMKLETGNVPAELAARLGSGSQADDQKIILDWLSKNLRDDPAARAARAELELVSDVIPMAIASGAAKLRRAQSLSGPDRDALLAAAEHAFLSVRGAAEGQPEFHLGLGEIYARLGKHAESDAELDALLARGDPVLGMRVAEVYRTIGGVERAKQIATELFGSAPSPAKEQAARFLGILTIDDPDEAERWFRRADPADPHVRTALLELQGIRHERAGEYAECGRKFAEAARAHLASGTDPSAHNNAAVAHQRRFACTGELAALRDAETSLEQAHRALPDNAIVVGNYVSLLASNGDLRVLGKRIALRSLPVEDDAAEHLLGVLLDGSEREAVLADLEADPSWRRARELVASLEVLSPHGTTAYRVQGLRALRVRDADSLGAIVGRMRAAKLDTTRSELQWKRQISGELDAEMREILAAEQARYERALSGTLDAKTRGAAGFLLASTLNERAVLEADPELVARARRAHSEAAAAWPALRDELGLAEMLIDEAALRADAKRWVAIRRNTSSVHGLAELVAANDPLAAKIRGSELFAAVVGHARAATGRPGLMHVRLARLLGDRELEARWRPAFDDKATRLALELAILLLPNDDTDRADLAYFDAR